MRGRHQTNNEYFIDGWECTRHNSENSGSFKANVHLRIPETACAFWIFMPQIVLGVSTTNLTYLTLPQPCSPSLFSASRIMPFDIESTFGIPFDPLWITGSDQGGDFWTHCVSENSFFVFHLKTTKHNKICNVLKNEGGGSIFAIMDFDPKSQKISEL